MSDAAFTHDVFLSRSAKDKAVVRVPSLSASNGERAGVRYRGLHLAGRLCLDGLEHSEFGLRISDFGLAQPGMSANAFGPDWAQLEAGTLGSDFGPRTLDFGLPPPLRLDDAPIRGSLEQFHYAN